MGLNIGDTGKKLGFLKDYASLVVPVIIVIIALIFLVISPLLGGKLSKKVESESLSNAKRISSLQSNVPPRNQWEIEAAFQEAKEQDANEIYNLVVQTTQREPLRYKLFPEPNEKSTLIFGDFGDRYQKAIEGLVEKVNGRDCPTEDEIQRHLGQGTATAGRGTSSYFGSGRGKASFSAAKGIDVTIVDAICRQKAMQAGVYVNSWDIAGYNFWDNFSYDGWEKAINACWTWQVGYWIIEDVFETVKKCNENSTNVFDAPIKRIISTGFTATGQSQRTRKSSDSANENETGPVYVVKDEQGLTHALTNRKCNDRFDVVHFTLSVVVDSKAILRFTDQLCGTKEHKFKGFTGDQPQRTYKHNQITVLDYDIEQIERNSPEHELYRYGDQPVVRLNLVCEYVFVKEGYEPVMPQTIKDIIAGDEESGT
ncbi:MAG: hypothetical protein PHF37_04090 [Phycisphaerae bacterium]|nr:hypothetical protein [Phycisphaerae bacterium]